MTISAEYGPPTGLFVAELQRQGDAAMQQIQTMLQRRSIAIAEADAALEAAEYQPPMHIIVSDEGAGE